MGHNGRGPTPNQIFLVLFLIQNLCENDGKIWKKASRIKSF